MVSKKVSIQSANDGINLVRDLWKKDKHYHAKPNQEYDISQQCF
jgi:hypothetical protein